MSRSGRLFALLQALRRRRRPVAAAILAAETGVSLRTVYRDIATLIEQGASIEGEAGVGYRLAPGFLLPPLMFQDDEVEALVLGLRFAAERGDRDLSRAAVDALAKVAAVLPERLRETMPTTGLLVGPTSGEAATADVAMIRRAIRLERRLALRYVDGRRRASRRLVWPIALGYFDRARVLVAWCELRRDFRHFRLDRIADATADAARYPRRRVDLLKAWRQREDIPEAP
ncbi:MAG: YafY family transcriptional regulator [Alphaproteobacteria bacterium]|nr:YafY family transcriptional regulator [Alphaproteobacteria bacterium]